MPVQSPCIRACKLHPETKDCTGCGRSLEEIATWSRMSDAQRLQVVERLGRQAA